MIKAFVAGWPVSHSLSPSLHGFWLERYRIEGTYEAVPVEPARFEAFLKALPSSGFAGGNVTIPHKETAFSACDHLDAEARAIGAVNTVWLDHGKICGSCTDAYGFSANLDQQEPEWRSFRHALVMGAGGASRAVVHALLSSGSGQVSVVNRTFDRARAISQAFGPRVSPLPWDMIDTLLPDADLIVNTTPLGMEGQGADAVDLLPAKENALVTDIVYVPVETPLLQSARLRGLKTVDGLGMLLHQAVPGFEKWFGIRPEVDEELRLHLLSILAARAAKT